MTDTTTAPVTDPGPPPPRPPGAPRPESAFFAWIRGLGVPRTRGWLGGVCSGLAARMGIDPVIVRGMFVVAALIGFPALLVYAICWALLPDLEGRIPAQELGRGRFEPALIAIGIMVVLTFVPVVPWIWGALFWPFSGGYAGGFGVVNTVLTVLLVAGVIALVIWLAVRASSRSRGGSVPGPRTASADPAAPGSPSDATVTAVTMDAASTPYLAGYAAAGATGSAEGELAAAGAASAGGEDAAEPPASDSPMSAPDAPQPPAGDASADELAAWRLRQDEWRAQRDAWRRQQAEADAVAREQARIEREAAGRAFAAEAEARRRARQAANPRASAVLVLAVLGAAIVAGAITALVTGDRGVAVAATAGVLVAAVVCAAGMVIAGAARRRSGFLAFSTIVLLVAGLVTGVALAPGRLALGGVAMWGYEVEGQRVVQPFDQTTIWLEPYSDGAGPNKGLSLRKGTGFTAIHVQPGATLELDARLGAGSVTYTRLDSKGDLIETVDVPAASSVDGARTYRWSVASDDPDGRQYTIPVRIDQNGGDIQIVVQEREAAEESR